jgi:hypothetical protein
MARLPDGGLRASVLLPQGRGGPAFLAYPNFAVLFNWNKSMVYVTTAAYFATRLEGAAPYDAGTPAPGLSDQRLGPLQIDADQLADALFLHGHAEQPVHPAMVTAWWVMIRNRVSVRRVISSSRSQNRVTLASSSGASTSSSTQIGRGVGQEHRKDQRQRRQRLFAPRQQRQRGQLLARRLAHDFQPRLQRIVGFHQHQPRLAARRTGG